MLRPHAARAVTFTAGLRSQGGGSDGFLTPPPPL
jgi:hypothetical protein